jgi:hypothetical protein
VTPWPVNKPVWKDDREVAPAVFPSKKIDCDELNNDDELTQKQ